jgi:hypothetical protein
MHSSLKPYTAFIAASLLHLDCLHCALSGAEAKLFSLHRRTVVSIPNGPSPLAVKEAAWGLARYAAISQVRIFFLSLKVRTI